MSNLSPAAILHNTAGTEVGTGANPVRTDPTGTTAQPVSDGGGSLTVDGTVTANAGTGPWPVTDNGGSLTIDAASLPLPAGAATAALQTQPGVDIGDVTVNNAAGASAVNIQDGGNSITIDATALPLPTGAATETTLAAIDTKTPAQGQALMAASSPVVIASNQTVIPVSDNAGSLTTDTPQLPVALVGGRLDVVVGAALPAGTNNIGDVDVVSSALPTGAATAANQATLISQTDGIEGLLTTIDADTSVLAAVDFATQTTLATLATEAKLEAVRVLLASLDGKDFATQATLAAILVDTGQIEALLATIDADTSVLAAVDFATQTTLAAFLAAFNAEDFATQTTLATLLTQATGAAMDAKLATIDAVLDSIKDTDGIKKITDALPVGDNAIGRTKLIGPTGTVTTVTVDGAVNRLEILGKVQVTGASPPPSTNPGDIFAATPLVVGTHDTTFVIPNGQTYFLQEVVAGNEDPTKGASVEIIYFNGTEHLVARIYIAGQTLAVGFPDQGMARDGTAMVGNVGGTNTVIVRRAKFSGTNISIDAVVRGYTV